MSAGQSDRHNQICACQNTTNRVFVPVNDRDRTLISRLGHIVHENHESAMLVMVPTISPAITQNKFI